MFPFTQWKCHTCYIPWFEVARPSQLILRIIGNKNFPAKKSWHTEGFETRSWSEEYYEEVFFHWASRLQLHRSIIFLTNHTLKFKSKHGQRSKEMMNIIDKFFRMIQLPIVLVSNHPESNCFVSKVYLCFWDERNHLTNHLSCWVCFNFGLDSSILTLDERFVTGECCKIALKSV